MNLMYLFNECNLAIDYSKIMSLNVYRKCLDMQMLNDMIRALSTEQTELNVGRLVPAKDNFCDMFLNEP